MHKKGQDLSIPPLLVHTPVGKSLRDADMVRIEINTGHTQSTLDRDDVFCLRTFLTLSYSE
jgi:hypothetical protein